MKIQRYLFLKSSYGAIGLYAHSVIKEIQPLGTLEKAIDVKVAEKTSVLGMVPFLKIQDCLCINGFILCI